MDVVTHGLASYALTRAVFPRVSRVTMAGVIVAGMIADVDMFSARFGPSAFLKWHRTYAHSLTAAFFIAMVISLVLIFILRRSQNRDSAPTILFAALGASLLHVAMDFCQNDSVQVFWPFRTQRYSADLVSHFDLWILLLLLAGVLLPKLFGLVTEEIGAKSKAPRGRIGATLALAAVFAYVGTRFVLHGDALAMMESRTYRGELPRKVAALAEPDSPLRWHGVVETERALRDAEVNVGLGSRFDPEAGVVSYKPGMSPPLEAAQKTDVARRFLEAFRFPKASVEQTINGYRIEIRGFPYPRDDRSGLRVMTIVETDANALVTRQELTWDPLSK